jgi:Zn-dependent protease
VAVVLWAFVAVVVLPFLLGWWIGNRWAAAAAFGALAATVFLRQLQLSDEAGDDQGALLLGIAGSFLLSAASAWLGGTLRQRRQGTGRR